jgi:hypothetical protein
MWSLPDPRLVLPCLWRATFGQGSREPWLRAERDSFPRTDATLDASGNQGQESGAETLDRDATLTRQ